MTFDERVQAIIQRINDGMAEKDLKNYLFLALRDAYDGGCKDTEKVYEALENESADD